MNEEINLLDTEKSNSRTSKISESDSLKIVELINYEDSLIPKLIAQKKDKIAEVIDLVYSKLKKKNGRLIYIGAGTSGRIGILDASEIYPTYGVKNKIIAIMAGGLEAIYKPKENCEDDSNQSVLDLKKINFTQDDVLIGLTASGRTPYVIGALEYAHKIGAKTASIANVASSKVSHYSDIAIDVNTGAEAITGSTRMKAGSCQKMICNMISTGVMIKLGYVEGNYMINLIPTNKKLCQRSKNIIKEITNASDEKINEVFEKTKNVKLSIMMIKDNLTFEEAKRKYEEIYESR